MVTGPSHRNHCCHIVRGGVSHRRRRRRGGATKARGNLDTQASGGCGAWEPLPAIGGALQRGAAQKVSEQAQNIKVHRHPPRAATAHRQRQMARPPAKRPRHPPTEPAAPPLSRSPAPPTHAAEQTEAVPRWGDRQRMILPWAMATAEFPAWVVPAATQLPPSSNAMARCSVGGGVVRVGAASRPPSPHPPTPRCGRTARPASWPSDEAQNTSVGGCGSTAAVAPRRGQLLRRARAFAGRWPIHAPLAPPPGNVQRGRRGGAFQGAPQRGIFCCFSDGGAERRHE